MISCHVASSWKKTWFGVCLAFVSIAMVTKFGLAWIKPRFVNVHQKSVTKSIKLWGEERSKVFSNADARQSIAMLGYIQHYYVPGPGYQGTPDVESLLERTRGEAIQKIVVGLQNYSGTNFGTNVALWEKWLTARETSGN